MQISVQTDIRMILKPKRCCMRYAPFEVCDCMRNARFEALTRGVGLVSVGVGVEIEKSRVVISGFGKLQVLEAGAAEVVDRGKSYDTELLSQLDQ